jgi:hypothetical protein
MNHESCARNRLSAWKRFWQLPEKQDLRVEVILLQDIDTLEPKTITKSEVAK